MANYDTDFKFHIISILIIIETVESQTHWKKLNTVGISFNQLTTKDISKYNTEKILAFINKELSLIYVIEYLHYDNVFG